MSDKRVLGDLAVRYSDKPNGFILGFDPGGTGNFGWSVCRASAGTLQPSPITGLSNDAWDALNEVKEALGCGQLSGHLSILAAGIDAPMFWSKRGNRTVDDYLRRQLKTNGFPPSKLGGAVQQVNSLRGACLVQGMLLGRHLREEWNPPLTEAHPTALRYLLRCIKEPDQEDMVHNLTAGLVDHELDATLSAVAAWAMIHEPHGWRNLYDQECCPVGTHVGYWMPHP